MSGERPPARTRDEEASMRAAAYVVIALLVGVAALAVSLVIAFG